MEQWYIKITFENMTSDGYVVEGDDQAHALLNALQYLVKSEYRVTSVRMIGPAKDWLSEKDIASSRLPGALSILTQVHPQYHEFIERLAGAEGCNFREDEDKGQIWTCFGDHCLTQAILHKYYPKIDAEATIKALAEMGGGCDCEIVFNCQSIW